MKFRQTVAVGLLLLMLLGSVSYQPVQAQTGSQTFPQTGQTVSGRFLTYWRANGGLAQQGYPISGEFEERSDLDGKTYRVQYFERATFELHPENRAPYDVLLSQLGTFRFREKYGAAGAPGQRANTGNARVFRETGKQIGGRFRTYWEQNGGLAQQGFPISNEFEEVSPLDGKVYTVQYFERAVFEVHNENRAPYNVLLSQLGRFRYDAKYKTATPPAGTRPPLSPAPATPAATATPSNSAINPGPPQQLSPGVTGLVIPTDRYVFWQNSELNGPSSEVYGYDIQTRQPFTATTAPGERFLITGSGDQLIWIDVTDTDTRLIVYNATTRQTAPLATTLPDNFSGTTLSNGVLYYGVVGDEAGATGTFAYNLSNSRTQKISDIPGEGLLVSGDALVAATTTSDEAAEVQTTTLRLFNLTGGNERVIGVVRGGFSGFDADANRVVWAGSFDEAGDTGLYIYDRTSGRTTRFTSDVSYYPVLKGNLLAWTTYNFDTSAASLKAVNLAGGPTTTVIRDNIGEILTFGFAGTDTLVYTVLDEASSGEDVPIRLFIVKLGAGSASLPSVGAETAGSKAITLLPPVGEINTFTSIKMSGHFVVWNEWDVNSGHGLLRYYDLNTSELGQVTGLFGVDFDVDNTTVVWKGSVRRRDGVEFKGVVGENLNTGEAFTVGQPYSYYGKPAIAGDMVAWPDNDTKGSTLILSSLTNPSVAKGIAAEDGAYSYIKSNPEASSKFFVWAYEPCDSKGGPSCNTFDKTRMAGFNIETKRTEVITTFLTPNLLSYDVDYNNFVWSNGSMVYLHNLESHQHQLLLNQTAFGLYLKDDYLLWSSPAAGNDCTASDCHIYAMRLSEGKPVQLTYDAGDQTEPAVSGDILVYKTEAGIVITSLSAAFAAASK